MALIRRFRNFLIQRFVRSPWIQKRIWLALRELSIDVSRVDFHSKSYDLWVVGVPEINKIRRQCDSLWTWGHIRALREAWNTWLRRRPWKSQRACWTWPARWKLTCSKINNCRPPETMRTHPAGKFTAQRSSIPLRRRGRGRWAAQVLLKRFQQLLCSMNIKLIWKKI